MKCSGCGENLRAEAPLSNMGNRMYGRGVDSYTCWNPRCRLYGVEQ